jgi:membrane protease YdiL (CAAX protease family)
VRRALEVGVLSGYAAAGAIAAGIAVALGQDPLTTPSWVGLEGDERLVWSVVLGGVLGAVTILATRVVARRVRGVRALHEALRPAVRDVDGLAIGCMALASGVGEELLFRGLLVPLVGVVLSALAFGLLHQVRGPARWVWASWAFGMGLLFGLLFVITGSLVGPIVAHVAINFANLRFIRDNEPGGYSRSPLSAPSPHATP